MMTRLPRQLLEPGIINAFQRTMFLWFSAPKPSKYASKKKKDAHFRRLLISYLFFSKVSPGYYRLISKLTKYYPLSLLYQQRWFHADNIKASNFRYKLEALSQSANLPIQIDYGHRDRDLSAFYGRFTKRVADKTIAVERLGQVFRDKFSGVYTSEDGRDIKILVDNSLLI